MTVPRVAVVTIVRGRHAHLAGQIGGLLRQVRSPDTYVVVAIDDPGAHVADIVANANVFADKWSWWPMQTWLEQFCDLGLARRGLEGHWQTNDLATQRSMRAGSADAPERRG